jgi:hypothetical protein
MNKLIIFILGSIFIASCENDTHVFTMKAIRLNHYHKAEYPAQNLSLKVVDPKDKSVLGVTDSYPSNLTLPATFAINPSLHLQLYKEDIVVQLWGDSTGYMTSSEIDMDEYKIIFPIDMETENDSVNFSVLGSWK